MLRFGIIDQDFPLFSLIVNFTDRDEFVEALTGSLSTVRIADSLAKVAEVELLEVGKSEQIGSFVELQF